MTFEVYSPDELLRIQTATSLRRHEGIRRALRWYRGNPEELSQRTQEFDVVIGDLKKRLVTGSIERGIYRHAAELEDLLQGKNLPSLHELASLSQEKQSVLPEMNRLLKSIDETFHAVGDLLSADWSWASSLNPQQTASGLLIEGYGLMAEKHFQLPGLRRAFVMAFEEVLIINHSTSQILKDVVGWMREEKSSFSPYVQTKIEGI